MQASGHAKLSTILRSRESGILGRGDLWASYAHDPQAVNASHQRTIGSAATRSEHSLLARLDSG